MFCPLVFQVLKSLPHRLELNPVTSPHPFYRAKASTRTQITRYMRITVVALDPHLDDSGLDVSATRALETPMTLHDQVETQ